MASVFKIKNDLKANQACKIHMAFHCEPDTHSLATLLAIDRMTSRSVVLREIMEEWAKGLDMDELIGKLSNKAYMIFQTQYYDIKEPKTSYEYFKTMLIRDLNHRALDEKVIDKIISKVDEIKRSDET